MQLMHLGRRHGADIVGEDGLGQADKRVAVDSALLIEAYLNAILTNYAITIYLFLV